MEELLSFFLQYRDSLPENSERRQMLKNVRFLRPDTRDPTLIYLRENFDDDRCRGGAIWVRRIDPTLSPEENAKKMVEKEKYFVYQFNISPELAAEQAQEQEKILGGITDPDILEVVITDIGKILIHTREEYEPVVVIDRVREEVAYYKEPAVYLAIKLYHIFCDVRAQGKPEDSEGSETGKIKIKLPLRVRELLVTTDLEKVKEIVEKCRAQNSDGLAIQKMVNQLVDIVKKNEK